MSDTIIRVENLSKKYIIGHQKQERYTALRDVIANGAKSVERQLVKPFGKRIPDPAVEEFWALKDVSFEIKRGDRVGIIGRNGAGKSTLLKILSRITEPTSGRISIKGRVASLLEVGTGFHPELTGRENIFLNGAILGMSKVEIKRKFDEIVAFAEVEQFLDTPVKRYSSGMYVRLAFAVAAHLEPEILVVDEVLAVGDVAFQEKCLGKMKNVGQEGRTVLFVSHNRAAIQALCKIGILLKSGHLIQIGDIENVNAGYNAQLEKSVELLQEVFPLINNKYGIRINDCKVYIGENSQENKLMIELNLETDKLLTNIGIGVTLTSIEGVKVSILAPVVTNHVIKELNGCCSCLLYCEDVSLYLASGSYLVGLWISRPRTGGGERLLEIDAVARIEIPATDVFGSGMSFNQHFGFVPLPLKMQIR